MIIFEYHTQMFDNTDLASVFYADIHTLLNYTTIKKNIIIKKIHDLFSWSCNFQDGEDFKSQELVFVTIQSCRKIVWNRSKEILLM